MALDKCPDIWPIGIGEIWRRLLAKRVLKVAGVETKDTCGNVQLFAGLETGIVGAMHATRDLCSKKEDKEEWGFLLVDATNAFNVGNRIACLWTARYHWPSGARFSFNCYRHQALLLVHADDGYAGHWLWSCEGVKQGDPLAMIFYGLGMLPLKLMLKANVHSALQLLYADYAAMKLCECMEI